MLWAPAMAMLSDGAERVGLEQGFAFALMNLAWATGQRRRRRRRTARPGAPATSVPYLILAASARVTFAVLVARRWLAARRRAR